MPFSEDEHGTVWTLGGRDPSDAARRAQWMEPCTRRKTGWDRLPHNRRRWDVALMVGWLAVVVCAAIWAVLS